MESMILEINYELLDPTVISLEYKEEVIGEMRKVYSGWSINKTPSIPT